MRKGYVLSVTKNVNLVTGRYVKKYKYVGNNCTRLTVRTRPRGLVLTADTPLACPAVL